MEFFWTRGAAILGALTALSCAHPASSQVAAPKPTVPIADPTVLPFHHVLDAASEKRDSELHAKLLAFDAKGDRDGIFTRGDAWAAGEPQAFGDLHIHPFQRYSVGGLFMDGLPDSTKVAKSPSSIFTTQVTTPLLRRGATNVLFAAAYVGTISAVPNNKRSDFEEAIRQLEETKKFIAAHALDYEVALSAADVRRITAAGRIAVVLCVEGGHVLRTIDDVGALYAAGVRMITVTHFDDNRIAGAAMSTLSHPENFHLFGKREKSAGFARNVKGLTPFGREVIRRMAELGIVIDLAHCSDVSAHEALAATADLGVPVVISHTAARALHRAERNASDETMRAVADRGGVVALTTYRAVLATDGVEECRSFGAHFRHLLALVGPEHIAIGTDMNGSVPRPRACAAGQNSRAAIHQTGLRNIGDMPALLQTLVQEGVPPATLENMGGNLIRVMEEVELKSSKRAEK